MPLFNLLNNKLTLAHSLNFKTEKELQNLIELNLETVFKCRVIATEFFTGSDHSGRIDTLAISESNNPVIIEYKKTESSELITQSLFYLDWLRSHRGDYEMAVKKKLGPDTEIDWSAIRVICLAPSFRRFDIHAVRVMGASLELWQYKRFDNDTFYLEEIFRRSGAAARDVRTLEVSEAKPILSSSLSYSFEGHLEKSTGEIKSLASDIRDFILSLDDSIDEIVKKKYVAYRVTQHFACVCFQANKVLVYLKMNPESFKKLPSNVRNVTNIGHYGQGDFEIAIRTTDDFEKSKKFIKQALHQMGL
jgi:Uncharacterized conserved protein